MGNFVEFTTQPVFVLHFLLTIYSLFTSTMHRRATKQNAVAIKIYLNLKKDKKFEKETKKKKTFSYGLRDFVFGIFNFHL